MKAIIEVYLFINLILGFTTILKEIDEEADWLVCLVASIWVMISFLPRYIWFQLSNKPE